MDAVATLLEEFASQPVGTSLVEVLNRLWELEATGSLQILSGAVDWRLELDGGLITFVSCDVAPLERLLWQLESLNARAAVSARPLRRQLETFCGDTTLADRRALYWLLERRYLDHDQARQVAEQHVQETLSLLLGLGRGRWSFFARPCLDPPLFIGEPLTVIASCLEHRHAWGGLAPEIRSAYQRPSLVSRPPAQANALPHLHRRLCGVLRNHSFRQLAALLGRPDLEIARGLLPYVQVGCIRLLPPSAPFHLLPAFADSDDGLR